MLLLICAISMQAFAADAKDTYVMQDEIISSRSGELDYWHNSYEVEFYVPVSGAQVTFDFSGSTAGYYCLFVYKGDSTTAYKTNTGEYGPGGYRGIPHTENTVMKLSKGSYRLKLTAADRGLTELDFTLRVYFTRTYTTSDPYYYVAPTPTEYNILYVDEPLQFQVKALPEATKIPKVTWSVSDTSLAKVNSSGKVTGKKNGVVKVTATFGEKKLSFSLRVIKPTYPKLAKFALYENEKKTLKVNVTPEGYPIKSLKWASSDTSIAKVNSKGVVTAKKPGKATITATVNGKTLSCTITVKKTAISATSKTVYVDDTYTLEVNGGTGKTTWASSDKSIAKVNSSGKVTGLKPGKATITAKKNGKTFKCTVTVKWPPEDGVTKTKTYKLPKGAQSVSKEIVLKGKATVTVTAKVNSGTDYDYIYLVLNNKYGSDLIRQSIYLKDGKFSKKLTLEAGTYRLYYNTQSNATITVKTVTKPQIIKTTSSVGRGYTTTLKVTGVKNGGTWSSSNTKIATVNSKGVVKGKKNGSCTIYYKMKDGTKISTKITVKNPVVATVTCVSDTAIYNDCYVKFTNLTNKTIDYVEVYIKQYNYKGSKLKSPYSYYYTSDNIKAGKETEVYFWVNNQAETCKVTIKKVKFTDGSSWKP